MTDPRRLTAYAGFVLTGMLIVAFALDLAIMATTGGPPAVYPATVGADLVRLGGSAIWPVEAWLYTLLLVPFAAFVVGVRAQLQAAGEELAADLAALAAILFMALHTLHNLSILTIVHGLAPDYAPGSAAAAGIETTARAFATFASVTFEPGGGVGGLLFIVALATFGIAQRRSLALGSSRLATASALLLSVGYAHYLVFAAFFVALLGWVAFIGWVVAVTAGSARVPDARQARIIAHAT